MKRPGRPSKAVLAERNRLKDSVAEAERVIGPPPSIPVGWNLSLVYSDGKAKTLGDVTPAFRDDLFKLLEGDTPLTREEVRKIAAAIRLTLEHERRSPEEKRIAEEWFMVRTVALNMQELRERGLSGPEAKAKIAKAHGWKIETLDRYLRKAKGG